MSVQILFPTILMKVCTLVFSRQMPEEWMGWSQNSHLTCLRQYGYLIMVAVMMMQYILYTLMKMGMYLYVGEPPHRISRLRLRHLSLTILVEVQMLLYPK